MKPKQINILEISKKILLHVNNSAANLQYIQKNQKKPTNMAKRTVTISTLNACSILQNIRQKQTQAAGYW